LNVGAAGFIVSQDCKSSEAVLVRCKSSEAEFLLNKTNTVTSTTLMVKIVQHFTLIYFNVLKYCERKGVPYSNANNLAGIVLNSMLTCYLIIFLLAFISLIGKSFFVLTIEHFENNTISTFLGFFLLLVFIHFVFVQLFKKEREKSIEFYESISNWERSKQKRLAFVYTCFHIIFILVLFIVVNLNAL
jgi:hypothetical protein